MAKDENYKRMIHSMRWLKLRRDVLQAHPLCVECAKRGLTVPATEVHHVRPVEDALTNWEKEQRMFDYHNLRPLCHACHVEAHSTMHRGGSAQVYRRTQAQLQEFKYKFLEAGDVFFDRGEGE
jgi:5-methylcytosine-specific restriction enzyme A